MLIGIDGNEANVREKVGVSVYTLKLLEYFQKQANKDLIFNVFLRHKPLPDLPEENSYFQYKIIPGKLLWSQFFLPLELYKYILTGKKIDVFFSPAHYTPRLSPFSTVVTIHDLSYFYYPDDFLKKDLYQLINWTKYSVEQAKKIIAVSKTTKKDLMKFYNVPESKIEVIYNGYDKKIQNSEFPTSFRRTSELRGASKIKNYILYVGTLQPRKNITTLIQAFKVFKEKNHDFKLVIAGKKGWLYKEIFALVEKLNLEKDVVFTGYVDDDMLKSLYQRAFCFVMPSLYEGFGIPILEAMSIGCPVISSFSSSLPEIGGEACLYFDPQENHDLVNKLTQLVENDHLRSQLIKMGKERVKLFSWKTCAKKTLEIIIKYGS